MTDVVVLGAGLAGLSAARDLAAGGADVVVLEARDRVGGRVEQMRVDDGRPAQLGGEVVGPVHTSYLRLVEELGLSLEPSYVAARGATTYDLFEGVDRGDDFPFATAEERADYERVEQLWGRLVSSVDPDDPWSHPDASRLDPISVGTWLRSVDALRSTLRRLDVGALALADGSIERTSALAELRKAAAVGERTFYSTELGVAAGRRGSAEVAVRMAAELDGRIRLGADAAEIAVSPGGCRVRLASGEELRAEAVVCALPASVADGSRSTVSSMSACAPVRAANGARGEGGRDLFALDLGRRRGERPSGGRAHHRLDLAAASRDALALVPPERIAHLLATRRGRPGAPRAQRPRAGCTGLPRARLLLSTSGPGRPIHTRAVTSPTGGPAT